MTDPFAGFVVDPANAAAVNAARTAADLGRALYAPLVLVGPRGSGKSHLLRAIRERGAANTPQRHVELVSLDRLAELLHARGFGEGARALRDRLLGADLLLIDDFDAVTRHLAAQALVFDLLESRLVSGKEVVVASVFAPGALRGLDPRLRRRLEGGTTVQLGLPGPEARQHILDQRVTESGVRLDRGVAEALAGQEFRSVKEYLGALNRVLAFQQATVSPLGAADALSLLGVDRPARGNGHAGGNGNGTGDDSAGGELESAPAGDRASELAHDSTASSEFDTFLSDVAANVAEQFDHWRVRLGEVIGHWRTRGVRTRRLEVAMAGEPSGDPEPLIAEFGRDAAELERLVEEARVLAPDLAGAEVLRDPDQLAAARSLVEEARSRRAPLSAPLADFTLDGLGIGASNRLAVEAARGILRDPAGSANPLVVVGPSGVGKTHLLHAIGNALVAAGLAPVACLSAHSFLGEVGGLRSVEEAAVWRARYQWVAAFALDDLHLLAHEPRAQEELLQIFAALTSGARPIVFSTDRRLSELDGFEPRLLTRLEGGLVVEMLPPDREVRLAVVRALLVGVPGGEEPALLDYLASRPADSVRAVQGSVQRVLTEARAERAPLSPALAREVLEVADRRVARPARRSMHSPASGILSPGLGVARSAEKMILTWPDPADRLRLELR